MLEALDLTPKQSQQVNAIKQDARKQLRALRTAGENVDRKAAKAIREQSKQAVDAVLTTAQKAKLEEIKAERKAAWKAVDREGLRAALEAYRTENVEPVLRASRGKLDAFISAEDQAEIERLRAVFAERPGREGRGDVAFKAKRASGRDKMTAKREAAKSWRAEHAADVESLRQLTQKYATELERIEEILAPSRKTWAADIRTIKMKFLPEGAAGKSYDKVRARRGEMPPHAPGKGRGRKGGAFLLLRS